MTFKELFRGTWVVQSVERMTLGFGSGLWDEAPSWAPHLAGSLLEILLPSAPPT